MREEKGKGRERDERRRGESEEGVREEEGRGRKE